MQDYMIKTWIDFSSSNIDNGNPKKAMNKIITISLFIEIRMLQSGALPLTEKCSIRLYADTIITLIKNN
jgi:hypothetical protein